MFELLFIICIIIIGVSFLALIAFFLFYFHALFNYAVYIKDTYNDMNDEIDLDKVMEAYENEQDIVED